MANQEKRGWVWDDGEKAWISSWKQEVRGMCTRINNQLVRFQDYLPAYYDEARKVADPYLNLADDLLYLDGRASGRKYQPMSPEEAKVSVNRLPSLFQEWTKFMNRQDITKAIQEKNKKIQKTNRDIKKKEREAKAEVFETLESEEYQKKLKAMIESVINKAGQVIPLSKGILNPVKLDKSDKKILQRLLLVHFVRFTYEFHPERQGQLKNFLEEHPEGTLKDIMRQAVYLVIKSHIKNPSSLSSPQEHIESLFASAFESLSLSMSEWKDKNQSIKRIGPGYFTILGEDFSLKAKPDDGWKVY